MSLPSKQDASLFYVIIVCTKWPDSLILGCLQNLAFSIQPLISHRVTVAMSIALTIHSRDKQTTRQGRSTLISSEPALKMPWLLLCFRQVGISFRNLREYCDSFIIYISSSWILLPNRNMVSATQYHPSSWIVINLHRGIILRCNSLMFHSPVMCM